MTAETERLFRFAIVFALRNRQGAAAAVLADLRECVRKYGRATPSVVGLAARTGYSCRQVIRATGWLELTGHVTITRRRAFCRGGTWTRSQTNLYTPRWPRKTCSYRGDMDDTSKTSRSVRTPHGAARTGTVVDKTPKPARPREPKRPRCDRCDSTGFVEVTEPRPGWAPCPECNPERTTP